MHNFYVFSIWSQVEFLGRLTFRTLNSGFWQVANLLWKNWCWGRIRVRSRRISVSEGDELFSRSEYFCSMASFWASHNSCHTVGRRWAGTPLLISTWGKNGPAWWDWNHDMRLVDWWVGYLDLFHLSLAPVVPFFNNITPYFFLKREGFGRVGTLQDPIQRVQRLTVGLQQSVENKIACLGVIWFELLKFKH